MHDAPRGQTFSRGAVLGIQAAVALVLVVLVLGVPAFGTWRESEYQSLGQPVAQPIPFSHKHHVGDDGIDCRYCHTTVETARHAGMVAQRRAGAAATSPATMEGSDSAGASAGVG